jgi:DNA mismatch endonuclease, patch repair protein
MSRVRSQGNVSTEMRLVALLRETGVTGWRRRIVLTGRPDFTWKAQRVALFVDGCFWHSCPKHVRIPKSRIEFWRAKLARNRVRDRKVNRVLKGAGWRVIRIWEHELKKKPEACIRRIIKVLKIASPPNPPLR